MTSAQPSSSIGSFLHRNDFLERDDVLRMRSLTPGKIRKADAQATRHADGDLRPRDHPRPGAGMGKISAQRHDANHTLCRRVSYVVFRSFSGSWHGL